MRLLFVVLIAFSAFFILFRFENTPVLVITKDERIIYTKRVEDAKFILTFVHSVEKTPVYEFYEVLADGTLYLYKTRYSSMGAGLLFQAEGSFEIKDGFFEAEIFRKFKEISLRVSHLDGHGIVFNNGKVMFKEIAQINDSLKIFCRYSLFVKFRFQ